MRASLSLPSLATLDLTPTESAVYRALHQLRGMFRTRGVTAGFLARQVDSNAIRVAEALVSLKSRGLAVRVNSTAHKNGKAIPVYRWKEGRCRG